MRITARTLSLCLAAPVVALALTGVASGTAAAAPGPDGCEGSMNAGFAYNGNCQGGTGTYRLEVDCFGYNLSPFAIGPYTVRKDLPVGQAGTVACFGPNWSSAGWGSGGRVFRL
ncbi:hypothetical protein [Nocardia sp. NPDC048505]|uniref:hypothetical protein n=1 Tax=unclassified Nocardia TaxID=2637762 RepID=UPI0033F93E7B